MKISKYLIFALAIAITFYGIDAKSHIFFHKKNGATTEVSNVQINNIFQDTIRKKSLTLPEAAVVGVKGIQEIGLGNLPQQAGYRGTTLDKMAVYIPHPQTTNVYMVKAITLQLHRLRSFEEKFEQGELKIKLCEAIDVNHPPGNQMPAQEFIIDPKLDHKFREGKQELILKTPLELLLNGLYVVAEWSYRRTNEDAGNRKTRSAPLAANLSLTESYTWTSIGDFKQTWQREGEVNSLSQLSPYYKGKIYNALMGVKVKEVE